MRLGILTQWFEPETGPATIPSVVARELAKRGHTVQVITGFPNYPIGKLYPRYRMRMRVDSRPQDRIHLRRVPLYPSHDSSSARRALNYASFGLSAATLGGSVFRNLDAIWVYNSPATIAVPMWKASLQYGVPTVLHVMDLWPDSLLLSGLSKTREQGLLYTVLTKWCSAMYQTSAVVGHTSPGIGLELQRRGVPVEKLAFLPLWADSTLELAGSDSRNASASHIVSPITILYAGALGRAQGLETFLQGLKIAQRHSDIRLRIAGSGSTSDEILNMITALGLSHVEYLGHLSTQAIVEPMQEADLHLVMLRTDPLSRITIPSKLFNTLALAKPFIACLEGDALQIATASQAAIPAVPDDPHSIAQALICAAALGKERLGEMGRIGRSYYLSNFSINAGVDRVESTLMRAARAKLTR